MFRQKKWSFTGASGKEYFLSILHKSEGLPQLPGVFVLAYVHPRGHLAGWQVNSLFVGHGENMCSVFDERVELDSDRRAVWNCNFVLLEPVASVREACVRDLEANGVESV